MKGRDYLYVLVSFLLSSCTRQPITLAEKPQVQSPQRLISTQAEERCILAKGKAIWVAQLDGSGQGMCQLPNGKRCNEHALFLGGCAVQ